ncbi:MAG: response regulator [Deltaproteobacteria bacterium]|nr:response regulator [Deltaproteobacteria bacterium]
MKIKHQIQKTFETVDAYAGIGSVEKRLRDNSFLVVLNEGSFAGILTAFDIIESPHNLVIDCLHEKPRIDCKQDTELVLKVMKESRNYVLPVFNGNAFIGVVLQAAITDFLFEYRNELERTIDKRTSQLNKANKQLKQEIEERKQAEEKTRKIEAQLQMAQKMEAIGTLAGGIAHDFNNLLMGIQGNTSLMFEDIDSSHPHCNRLKSIEKQIQSGVKLTSQLLGYARKGKYEVAPISLNKLVKEISYTFGMTRKETVIHQKFAEDLLAIEADQGQIEQVLLNLFVNAADAMPSGGNLILETMNVKHKDIKGKLYDPKAGNYVMLIIKDTGMGMNKSTAKRIFDPFFTTKKMGRGTGLGLASVYGIIKAHGGYIDVESKKKHGTTFRVYLPATKRKVRKVTKTSDKLIKATGTVLLVDDEEVIQKVCKELLENIGYKVFLANDGKKAIELYRKNQDEIDIVLLDMIMPNMSGGEAYDRMKKINPDIKVLLSSGYSIDGEATAILNRGCDSFIQKPFSINELSEKIRSIL